MKVLSFIMALINFLAAMAGFVMFLLAIFDNTVDRILIPIFFFGTIYFMLNFTSCVHSWDNADN